MIRAIIGANYGDEGKGLAVNHFTSMGKSLVVRHNGGAQSGHTVESNGKRFVFHELSSGSFNDASTLWLNTYHPDLYVLKKEVDEFYKLTGKVPEIYAEPRTKITLIDDVIINWIKESNCKAGSCGMGIWECVVRNNAGYFLTIEEVKNSTLEELCKVLTEIRKNYTVKRLKKIKDTFGTSEASHLISLLENEEILANYAAAIKENVEYVSIAKFADLVDKFSDIVFENGQGLLIDGDYDMEHGTPSKTGLYNVAYALNQVGKTLDEAVYVTRTYLTRHGRGNFVEECDFNYCYDETNVYNEWQEGIRYGKFNSINSLEERIKADCKIIEPSIFVTHAQKGQIITTNGNVDIDKLNFNKIYLSDNKTSAVRIK